jgi:hypothetical protein
MLSARRRTLFRWLVIPMLVASLLWSANSSGAGNELDPELAGSRRINAPQFDGEIRFEETAIAWFGHVDSTANSADVRIGYNDEHLYVRLGIMDRRLWYDLSPSPPDLTAWDSATLYLDLDGNVGASPDADAFRFDAQLSWWEERTDYQAAYVGNGDGWTQAGLNFDTVSGWRGDAPNTDGDDRAWSLDFFVPFTSLGLPGPPAEGTVWGLGVAVHDRDDAPGSPIADQLWPETLTPAQPSTWGQLRFGMPVYTPPPALAEGQTVIRQGLAGAVVPDAHVGGGTDCGAAAGPDYFPSWGGLRYSGTPVVNIQNLGDICDWPCFSRYYVTFPLSAIPQGKAIISATLTMYQWGNAGDGWEPGPQPSFIQVLTVDSAWDENTLDWNNSPLAVENVAATWAGIFPEWPGEPRTWDVSRVAAGAVAAGTPLQVALYESDWAYHSGKYFWSSDVEDFYQELRPTLVVAWGEPLPGPRLTANPVYGDNGDSSTYSVTFFGTGSTLLLTDTLPVGLGAPHDFHVEGTAVLPVYDAENHRFTWDDAPPLGQGVTIEYAAAVVTPETRPLVNIVELLEDGTEMYNASATFIANPLLCLMPIAAK